MKQRKLEELDQNLKKKKKWMVLPFPEFCRVFGQKREKHEGWTLDNKK